MLNADGFSVRGCSIIYAPAGQAGEYAKLAANPYRGCGHGCTYCLAPDTLIQRADGTSRPISDIQIGDALIGVGRREERRRAWNYTFGRSVVLNKVLSVKPAYRLSLENGMTSVCSSDHRWLTERGWKHTRNITTNNEVRLLGATVSTPVATPDYQRGYLAGIIRGDGNLHRYDYSGRYRRSVKRRAQKTDVLHQFRLAMLDTEALERASAFLDTAGVPTTRFTFTHAGGSMPAIRANSRAAFETITAIVQPQSGAEWQRGWLAGIFDAEGGTTAALRIHNTDEEIRRLIETACASFGFRTIRDGERENGCVSVRLHGGRTETIRFFNLTAPAIRRKFPVVGTALRGSSRVVAVEPLGREIEMVDITTSTENFIANGMVSHNCYVPAAIRMSRQAFDAEAVPKPDFLARLIADAVKYRAHGITEQCMLSFTTDPYNPNDVEHQLTRQCLVALRDHGLGFCTLTKGGSRALRDLDLFRPDRDAFASTLTTLDPTQSQEWERNAALPADRLATLERFHAAGIFTWVSLEPVYDTAMTLRLIEETAGYVDLYKIGRLNYHRITRETDWRAFAGDVLEVVNRLGKQHYIKKDLQPFLPAGYDNPKYVNQVRDHAGSRV